MEVVCHRFGCYEAVERLRIVIKGQKEKDFGKQKELFMKSHATNNKTFFLGMRREDG